MANVDLVRALFGLPVPQPAGSLLPLAQLLAPPRPQGGEPTPPQPVFLPLPQPIPAPHVPPAPPEPPQVSLGEALQGLLGRAVKGGQAIERIRQSLGAAAKGLGAASDIASRIEPSRIPPSVPFLARGVASALGIGAPAEEAEQQQAQAQAALALDEAAESLPPEPRVGAGERLGGTALEQVQELPFDPNPERLLQIYRSARDPHADQVFELYQQVARAELEAVPEGIDRKQMAVTLLAAAALGAAQAAASGDFRQTLSGALAGLAAGALAVAENQAEAEKLKREARLRAVKTLLEGALKRADLDAAERDRAERLIKTYSDARNEYLKAIQPSVQIINNFTLGIRTREIRGRLVIDRVDAQVIDKELREATILNKLGALRGSDDPGAVYAPNGIKLNLSALSDPTEVDLHKWASLMGRSPRFRDLWFDLNQQVIEEFREKGAMEQATTQGRTSDLATAITLATNLAFARALLGAGSSER